MSDPYLQPTPGEPFKGLSATVWKDLLSMLADWKKSRTARGPGEGGIENNPALVFVQNNSGQDVPQFGVLAYDPAAANVPIDPAQNLAAFQEKVIVSGIAPSASTGSGRFCITQEPIPKGNIGRAAVAGITPVQLDSPGSVSQASADIITGDVTKLIVGGSGFEVVYLQDGTGVVWGLIDLGCGSATAVLVSGFPNQAVFPIVGANAEDPGAFFVNGDQTGTFTAELEIDVVGSSGGANDGPYTVSSSTFNSDMGVTTVNVTGAVGADSAGGSIVWSFGPILTVAGVTASAGGSPPVEATLQVAGDVSSAFLAGWRLDYARTGSNDGTYTLASAPVYNANTKQTTFTVKESLSPSGTLGYLRGHYPGPQESPPPVYFPATFAQSVNFTTLAYNVGTPLTNLYSPGNYVGQGLLVFCQAVSGNWMPLSS
jgi:hypothetical protein